MMGRPFAAADAPTPSGMPPPNCTEVLAPTRPLQTEPNAALTTRAFDACRASQTLKAARPLSIGYSAFTGSGRNAVPRLLREVGFGNVQRIMKLDPLDGTWWIITTKNMPRQSLRYNK